MEKSQYKKLLADNITKTYTQSNNNVHNSINLEGKHIAKKLEIADRVQCMVKKPAYVTLNDHKEDFNINPKCCLIKPAKSELGKMAKSLWRISIKLSEKSYTATNGEINQMLLIGSKILPTK